MSSSRFGSEMLESVHKEAGAVGGSPLRSSVKLATSQSATTGTSGALTSSPTRASVINTDQSALLELLQTRVEGLPFKLNADGRELRLQSKMQMRSASKRKQEWVKRTFFLFSGTFSSVAIVSFAVSAQTDFGNFCCPLQTVLFGQRASWRPKISSRIAVIVHSTCCYLTNIRRNRVKSIDRRQVITLFSLCAWTSKLRNC